MVVDGSKFGFAGPEGHEITGSMPVPRVADSQFKGGFDYPSDLRSSREYRLARKPLPDREREAHAWITNEEEVGSADFNSRICEIPMVLVPDQAPNEQAIPPMPIGDG